jgi:SAM-dependent methyltransferase
VLSTSKDLKTSACTAAGAPPPALRAVLRKVPQPVTEKFYGCGAPLPMGIEGLRVLDLGSGSGRDCYAAAALVGERGSVVGVDMTDEQLAVAREHADAYCTQTLGYGLSNMRFVKGFMEDLSSAGVADGAADLVISNCVVNLSPDKPAVLREAFRVLSPGGEFYFSDVYADRRVPEAARKDKVLWGECVSGALYVEDFKREARAAGFEYPVHVAASPIEVNDADMRKLLGPARFYSVTFRLFKLPRGLLESCCEDYGQRATYRGTIAGSEGAYVLDAGHVFEAGRPTPVCGNTAAMLGEGGHSWLARHFDVEGDREVHFGAWGCGAGARHPIGLTTVDKSAESSGGGGCC